MSGVRMPVFAFVVMVLTLMIVMPACKKNVPEDEGSSAKLFGVTRTEPARVILVANQIPNSGRPQIVAEYQASTKIVWEDGQVVDKVQHTSRNNLVITKTVKTDKGTETVEMYDGVQKEVKVVKLGSPRVVYGNSYDYLVRVRYKRKLTDRLKEDITLKDDSAGDVQSIWFDFVGFPLIDPPAGTVTANRNPTLSKPVLLKVEPVDGKSDYKNLFRWELRI